MAVKLHSTHLNTRQSTGVYAGENHFKYNKNNFLITPPPPPEI